MSGDYLLRQIEMIARAIALIIARRKAGQMLEAAQEIQSQCRQGTGLSFETVQSMAPEALWDFCQQGGAQCMTRALLLAELLIQDAELNRDAGRHGNALRSQLQAFCLLAEVFSTLPPEDAATYRPKLAALVHDLAIFRDEPYVAQKLAAWDAAAPA